VVIFIKNKKKKWLFSKKSHHVYHHVYAIGCKEAVQTCILSTRWKNLWKQLSILSLNSRHFKTLGGFTKFVSRFLSLRDKKTALHTLNFLREGIMQSRLLKRIIKYVVSHNIQQIDISAACYIEHFSLCHISCHTLMSLNISAWSKPLHIKCHTC
jgi:hypothetical protein